MSNDVSDVGGQNIQLSSKMQSPLYPHEVVNANMSAATSTIFNMNQVYPSVPDGDLTNKTMKT